MTTEEALRHDPDLTPDEAAELAEAVNRYQPQSTTHTIPYANWHMALADAIEQSQDGDTIIVHNPSMKELAERAHGRMCPDKSIVFSIAFDEGRAQVEFDQEAHRAVLAERLANGAQISFAMFL